MAISAGVAYVDVLPNMKKFAPAVQGQAAASSGALAKFGKTGALAVAAVGAASVVMAGDFEKSMRNVNSIAGLPEGQFKKLNDEVLKLAGPTAQSPKTLADGLYDLVSSGFDASESMKILKSSAIAATAGLTTTEVSTKAVSAVLNAYKLPASKAKQVSDQLFETVNVGVLSFEELAANVGDVLSVATSVGVPLEQVGAALATMTKQGESPPEAATKLKAAMTALVKPSEEMSGVLEKLNVQSGAELVKKYGSLQGALEAVRGATDGSAEAMNKLFPNIRAAQGATLLTGQNAAGAAKDLDKLENSTGAASDAFKEQSKSTAVQFDKLKANLSVLAIKIGNVLLPVLNDVLRFFNTDFGPAMQKVGTIAVSVAGTVARAFVSAWNWLKTAASNVSNFIRTFAPLQFVIGKIKFAFEMLLIAVRPIWAAIKGGAQIVGSTIKALWGYIKMLAGVIGNVVGIVSNLLRGDWANAWRNAKELVAGVINGVKDGLSNLLNIVKTVFRAIVNLISSFVGAAKDAAIKVGMGIVNGIASAVSKMASIVKGAISGIGNIIGDIAGSIADWLNANTIFGNNIHIGMPGPVPDIDFTLPALAEGALNFRGGYALVGEEGPELVELPRGANVYPHGTAATMRSLGGPAGDERYALTITNWETGEGYMRRIAAGEGAAWRLHDRQRERMRR